MKTLYAGEATGLTLADGCVCRTGCSSRSSSTLRAEQLDRSPGRDRLGHRRLSLRADRLGRDRARQYFDANRYVGPAPVPLKQYVADDARSEGARGYIDRERMPTGSRISSSATRMLEQLGPAVNAGKAVFLYGPPGNGKTVIAEGMGRALGGDIYMPYALDIDGQIITCTTRSTTRRSRTTRPADSIIKPARGIAAGYASGARW